ncbi:MAG: hypothetical protein AABY15_07110 [Nanoarchaeota archaeon]
MKEKIELKINNVYLIKEVNHSSYKSLFEWECLEVSQLAVKFKDRISDRVFWVEKCEFHNNEFGPDGYFVFECIYDKQKEFLRQYESLTK